MNKIKKILTLMTFLSISIVLVACSPTYDIGVVDLKYYDNEDALVGYNKDLYYRNDLEFAGADPTVIYISEGEYEGYFMMYLAKSESVNVYKSKDLANWEVVSVCYTPSMNSWGLTDLWAPSCIYDEEEDKYFLFYSATNSNQEDGYANTKYLGMAYSESPVGPFIPYVGTNADGLYMDEGTPLVDIEFVKDCPNSGKFYRKGTSMIDAFPFVDPVTGDKYLYFSRTRNAHTANVIGGIKMKDWRTPDYDTYTELTKANYTTLEGTEVTERFEGYEAEVVNSGNAINEAPNMIYHDGTYYLTFSVMATTDPEYSVMQAIGTSPLGPFEKVQESHGGCVVGVQTESMISVWDHVLCTGSHSFVYDGEELWVVYHQDKGRISEGGTGVGDHSTRAICIDKVTFTKNDLGQTILHCNGPTTAIQPKVTSSSEYKNIIDSAKVTANTKTYGSKEKAVEKDTTTLTDGILKMRTYDHVEEFAAEKFLTIKIKFEDYKKIKSLLIYNSSDYYLAFTQIARIDFSFRKELEGKPCVGTARINNVNYDFSSYSNVDMPSISKNYMRPGAPMIFEFDELEVNEITIMINCPVGQEAFALNEIVVLGKGE